MEPASVTGWRRPQDHDQPTEGALRGRILSDDHDLVGLERAIRPGAPAHSPWWPRRRSAGPAPAPWPDLLDDTPLWADIDDQLDAEPDPATAEHLEHLDAEQRGRRWNG